MLGGDRAELAANDASLVLRVSYGRTAFLFPGDVEADGEAAAVARRGARRGRGQGPPPREPHLLERALRRGGAAHAGRWPASRRSNRYGFPHPEAVARWAAAGAIVLRTDEGAVRFLSDGRAVRRLPADDALDIVATWRERP